MTLTGACADAMEVEAVGDTADQRGDDPEAGAGMNYDDVGDEGGALWVKVLWAALTIDVDMLPCEATVTSTAHNTTTQHKRSHKKKHHAVKPKQAHERKMAAEAKFVFRPDSSNDWHHDLPSPGRPGN